MSHYFPPLSSLKDFRTQLLADFQDKSEAIKLTTKCITHEVNTLSCCFPAAQYKPNYVSYDKWLSHCRDLRLAADNLIKDSSSFRGNLRFTLANVRQTLDKALLNKSGFVHYSLCMIVSYNLAHMCDYYS